MALSVQTTRMLNKLHDNSVNLKAPKICTPSLETAEQPIPYDQYFRTLHDYGFLIVSLEFDDPEARTFARIVNRMGKPHGHDSSGKYMWDIKKGGATGGEALARSHNLKEFVLHTDGSFEDPVPDHFGLFVVEPDKMGGGKNLLIDTLTLIQHLSDKTVEVLQSRPFRIRIPPEFDKGIPYVTKPLLDEDLNIRYRAELIDLEQASVEQLDALEELEGLAYNTLLNRAVSLKKGQMFFLNNRRFLHARTDIKDPNRHLKRIRFFLNPSPEMVPQSRKTIF